MSGKRYTEEFKIEAVKQVTERNRSMTEVAERLGISHKSLHDWVKRYSKPTPQRQEETAQAEEIRKLKAELRRVTEERDILKEAAVYFAGESKKSTRS